MKARHIRKLREKISNFDEFEIAESCYVFGEPYGVSYYGRSIKADTPQKALQRYTRKYSRIYKELHKWVGHDVVTTSNWGKFRVLNKRTGYKTYFY